MEIAKNPPFTGPETSARTSTMAPAGAEGARSFSSFLETAQSSARIVAASAQGQGEESPSTAKEDVEFIKKNGFQAYLERNHERKLEEMREQILRQMGLDEESLAAMPAEQRALIEKMVAEEIQARLAAEAEFNRGAERNKTAASGMAENLQTPMAFLDAPGRMQAMVGFSIIDAVGGRAALTGQDGDRQFLPGRDPNLPFL